MTFRRWSLILLLLVIGIIGWAYRTAIADPVLRHTTVTLSGLADGTAPIRALLISDIHVAGPDMPPERLARIVTQINALNPDLVLIAGDFTSDKQVSTHRYSFKEAVAPLELLHPKFGTIAVLGNHDHWRNADDATAQLEAVGVKVLANEAVRVGPLVVGGLDDDFTGHADIGKTISGMTRFDGARILVSHSPDPFPQVPETVELTVAGHTHCGQIRLPVIGAIAYMSRYGSRYACGEVREGKKTVIVGAGLGTSLLPLRLGAVPDMWLINLVAHKSR